MYIISTPELQHMLISVLGLYCCGVLGTLLLDFLFFFLCKDVECDSLCVYLYSQNGLVGPNNDKK